MWLAVEVWHARDARRPAWRAAALVAAPALALPLVVYAAFLTAVSPHELLFENLYPTDFVNAAGHVVLDAHAPLTAASFAELAARVLLYAAGAAVIVTVGLALGAGGRARTLRLSRSASAWSPSPPPSWCGPRRSAATWSSATTGSRPARGSQPPC